MIYLDAVRAGPRFHARDGFPFDLPPVRRRYPRTGTFFRAEDAFGFTKRVIGEIADPEAMEQSFREEMSDGSFGQQLTIGVARGQRGAYHEHVAITRAFLKDPRAFPRRL